MWTSAGKQGGILTGEGAENGRCGRWSSVSVQSGFSGGDNPCISCLISIHLTSSLYHFVRVVSLMENNVRLIPFNAEVSNCRALILFYSGMTIVHCDVVTTLPTFTSLLG